MANDQNVIATFLLSFTIIGRIKGSKEMFSRVKNNSGFTLLEIILVLLIVAIVSSIVISRVVSGPDTDLISRIELIKSHLRYAQSRAMNTNVVWGIRSNNSIYWLFRDGNENNKVILPGEETDTLDLTAMGISMENFRLSFDSWGVPYKDASASSDKKLKAGDNEAQIKVSSGGEDKFIDVTPNTGFIP